MPAILYNARIILACTRFKPLILIVGVLALCACGRRLDPEVLEHVRRGTHDIHISEPASVPFVGDTLLPLIEVSINGSRPYRFLIDLGANVVTLREDVARAIGAVTVQKLSTRSVVRVDSLRFGSALLRNVYVVTEPVLDVDGVLGFNIFRDGVLTLDYPGRRLEWRTGSLPQLDGGMVIPYEIRDRMPYILASIGKQQIWFNLDTGARAGMLGPVNAAQSLPLRGPVTKGSALWNQAEGEIQTEMAPLAEKVMIAADSVSVPMVLFSPALEDEFLLGSGALQDFTMMFDLRAKRVRFARKGAGA